MKTSQLHLLGLRVYWRSENRAGGDLVGVLDEMELHGKLHGWNGIDLYLATGTGCYQIDRKKERERERTNCIERYVRAVIHRNVETDRQDRSIKSIQLQAYLDQPNDEIRLMDLTLIDIEQVRLNHYMYSIV